VSAPLLRQLARRVSQKAPPVAAARLAEGLPGGVGTVASSTLNSDGTLNVTYLGTVVPCHAAGNGWVPLAGQTVLVFVFGTQLWCIPQTTTAVSSPPWLDVSTTVGYQSGWADQTFSGIFHGAQYRIVGDIVSLRGLVVRASGTNQPIFNLPVGFAPTGQETWSVDAGQAFGEVQVTIFGVVLFTSGTATNYVSLSGISFSIN
jgi:hypothetical protein